jgi:parvulin-like peptidyl-prolyl isomerase
LPPGGTVISTVNGKPVTQESMDFMLEQIPENFRKQMEQSGRMGELKEQLIASEVLYQEAITQKLHEQLKVKNAIAMAERSALADALIDKVVDERSTDERVKKYYDDHAVKYANPQVKPRLIIAKDKASADAITAEAKGGADFVQLAKTRSADPGAAQSGGELKWMRKQDLSRAIGPNADAVFGANKGDVVGPLEANGTFFIFKLDDKRESIPLDEVKDEIKGALKQELAQEYIKELRDKATVADGAGGATVTAPAPGAPAAGAPAGAAPAGGAPATPPSGH